MDNYIKTIFPDTKDGKILLWCLSDKTSAFVNSAEDAISKLNDLQNKNNIYMGCCLSDKDYGMNNRCNARIGDVDGLIRERKSVASDKEVV